jgi:hypothetical protein
MDKVQKHSSFNAVNTCTVLMQLRLLDAGYSPQRLGFIPKTCMWYICDELRFLRPDMFPTLPHTDLSTSEVCTPSRGGSSKEVVLTPIVGSKYCHTMKEKLRASSEDKSNWRTALQFVQTYFRNTPIKTRGFSHCLLCSCAWTRPVGRLLDTSAKQLMQYEKLNMSVSLSPVQNGRKWTGHAVLTISSRVIRTSWLRQRARPVWRASSNSQPRQQRSLLFTVSLDGVHEQTEICWEGSSWRRDSEACLGRDWGKPRYSRYSKYV